MNQGVVNPGAGPVPGRATLAQAWRNARALRGDLRFRAIRAGVTLARGATGHDIDGRYAFVFGRDRWRCEVLVPGCPMHLLEPSNEPRHGTRLGVRFYVLGNSWTRQHTLEIIRSTLKIV